MDYQVEKNTGEVVDKIVIEYIAQPVKNKPGLLELSGIQNGLWHSEQWRILNISDHFMIGKKLTV